LKLIGHRRRVDPPFDSGGHRLQRRMGASSAPPTPALLLSTISTKSCVRSSIMSECFSQKLSN